jgi:hypothetical protein
MTSAIDTQISMRIATGSDVERVAEFNSFVFRPSVGVTANAFMSGARPRTGPEHFVIAECNGRIVSSLCCLLQQWRFDGALLNVGQMELVGTHSDFRRRGLIRMQMGIFDEILRANSCVLSAVQGIPGVYQRLGYDYALPLKGGFRLWPGQIPPVEANSDITLRSATDRDLVEMGRLFDAEAESLMVSGVRDIKLWRYQETQDPEAEHAYETYVLDKDGKVSGYFRLRRHTKSTDIVIREIFVRSFNQLLIVLNWAKERVLRQDANAAIMLQIPDSHRAARAASYLGGEQLVPFAWQVRVENWPNLLRVIAGVLESRLRDSMFADWRGTLSMQIADMGTLAISIENASIAGIEICQKAAAWDVKTRPGLMTQLALGCSSAQELLARHPDFEMKPRACPLIDTLFPKRPSFVYEAY